MFKSVKYFIGRILKRFYEFKIKWFCRIFCFLVVEIFLLSVVRMVENIFIVVEVN